MCRVPPESLPWNRNLLLWQAGSPKLPSCCEDPAVQVAKEREIMVRLKVIEERTPKSVIRAYNPSRNVSQLS